MGKMRLGGCRSEGNFERAWWASLGKWCDHTPLCGSKKTQTVAPLKFEKRLKTVSDNYLILHHNTCYISGCYTESHHASKLELLLCVCGPSRTLPRYLTGSSLLSDVPLNERHATPHPPHSHENDVHDDVPPPSSPSYSLLFSSHSKSLSHPQYQSPSSADI